MRSFAILLVACGITFLCAFKDAQGLVKVKMKQWYSVS